MKNSECDGKTKNHLNDLETCSEDGKNLGDFDPHRPEGVVGVHDRVDGVVHHHEESASELQRRLSQDYGAGLCKGSIIEGVDP